MTEQQTEVDEYTRQWGYPKGTLRSIVCPTCTAAVEDPCVSSNGNPLSQVHLSRRRVSIREYKRSVGS